MPVHTAVVLAAVGIPGVEEAGSVGLPRHAGSSGIGDDVAQPAGVDRPKHSQLGVFGSAIADADGNQGTVGRGMEPVDGRGGIGAPGNGIDDDRRSDVGIVDRSAGECELVGPCRSLECEQPRPTGTGLGDHRSTQERDEALVPASPTGRASSA